MKPIIFPKQMDSNSLALAGSVLARLVGHVGRGYRDHYPGPTLQASARDELVE